MKLSTLLKCIALATLSSTLVTAREFRTPIPLLRYWLHTDPLNPSQEKSQLYAWTGYFERKADTARCTTELDGSSTTEKCPLSALLFNQADFSVNDIFATRNSSPINILFSTELSPRFKYIDRGAVLGFVASHAVNCNVVVGGRVAIPFRNFNMRLTQEPVINNQINQEVLNANVRETTQDIRITDTTLATIESYAYKLEFLTQLPVDWQEPGINVSLVDYANTQFVGFPADNPRTYPITIANQDVTNNFNTLDLENQNPVTVIKRNDGTAPNEPYALELGQAQSLDELPGSGTPVPNNGRRRFVITNSYAQLGDPNHREQRNQLWVVPSYVVTGTTASLVEPALIIGNKVDELIGSPEEPISAFFENAGITFNSQKRGGLGDIDAQFFTQYWWNTCSFVEGNIALRMPTAGTQVAPGQVLLQSLGNNGHPEIMLGSRVYWRDYDWLVLQADALYSFVLKRTENVAIPFQGATVKNIGSGIPAQIRWGYFLGHAEIATYPRISCKDYAVLRLGYELYHKTEDSISLQATSACSCLATPTRFNINNLKTRTKVTSHNLYGEVILRHEFNCLTAGIFANVGGVVGGTNTPLNTDWYVGLEFFI